MYSRFFTSLIIFNGSVRLEYQNLAAWVFFVITVDAKKITIEVENKYVLDQKRKRKTDE